MSTVVVGDIHGDFANLCCCLQIAGFVQEGEGQWRAPQSVSKIAFLGDFLDRKRYGVNEEGKTLGEVPGEELRILKTVNRLGCQNLSVLKILGNHEFMNFSDPPNYEYVTDFAKSRRHNEKDDILSELLYESQYVVCGILLKDEGMLFCHGQAVPNVDIDALNTYAKARLQRPSMSNENSPMETQLMKAIWGREMSCREKQNACDLAKEVCESHNVKLIFLGHTPQSMCSLPQAHPTVETEANSMFTEYGGKWEVDGSSNSTVAPSKGVACDCSGHLVKVDVGSSRGFLRGTTLEKFKSHYLTKRGSHRPQVCIVSKGMEKRLRVVTYEHWETVCQNAFKNV